MSGLRQEQWSQEEEPFSSSLCLIHLVARLLVNSAWSGVCCKCACCWWGKRVVLNLNGGHEAQFSSGQVRGLVVFFK